MIDEKDIEIAKLRGQVEALEKLVKQMMVSPPQPHIVPMPYPVPSAPRPRINPHPWEVSPFWYMTTQSICPPSHTFTTCAGQIDLGNFQVYTNAPGVSS